MVIGVDYDGADLTEVAELIGLTPDEVVAAHTGQAWTVGFCGFAPGFGYLHGENDTAPGAPPSARRGPRCPAGAVGLADVWSGHLPAPRSRRLAADRAHRPGRCGTSTATRRRCCSPAPSSASSPTAAERACVVEQTGPLALLRTWAATRPRAPRRLPFRRGRPGGVRLANRLVGNRRARPPSSALLGGLAVTADALHWVAVTGAPTDVLVNGTPAALAHLVAARRG